METFSEARDFVEHPSYQHDRRKVLSGIKPGDVDAPIREIVTAFGKLPQCFTLQICYGHFVWEGQPDKYNLDVLPLRIRGLVRYRIAYLALCIENNDRGAHLRDCLASICETDRKYVQFGSPDWFWQQYPNSYALQVEPERFASQDEAWLEHAEALHVQTVRDGVFQGVIGVLADNGIRV